MDKNETSDPDESDQVDEVEDPTNCEDEDLVQGVIQNRRFMAAHCLRHGKDCRYAFKTMQDVCRKDPTMFVNTIVDLALEAKFLSAVRHPNIIKMRAMAAGGLCQSNFFIIMDRLYDTLNDRLAVWKKKANNGFAKFFDFHKKNEKRLMATRLMVAYDVASALEYLHNRK